MTGCHLYKMINIGCHLSSSGGFTSMFNRAIEIGANTFQYFTRNPRGGVAKEINKEDIDNFLELSFQNNFSKIIAHAPYTLNLCSSKEYIRNFSKNIFADDLLRVESVPNSLYNFHPGSHTGQGVKVGISQISGALNEIIKPNQTTIVLLETMAGKGSEIGGNFKELKQIIDNVDIKDKIGVCFDTCHVFDAGYDIVNDLDGVLKEFDDIIGIDMIKAVHLNDSKNVCGSKKDRHEKIGQGNIGIDVISSVVNHPYLKNLPFILETPQEDLKGYADEISLIKSKIK